MLKGEIGFRPYLVNVEVRMWGGVKEDERHFVSPSRTNLGDAWSLKGRVLKGFFYPKNMTGIEKYWWIYDTSN